MTLRRLALADQARFATLAAMSRLHSLDDDAHRRRLLQDGVVIAAVALAGEVVGCCCIEPCTIRDYVHRSGRVISLPRPNAYLCGAFVHPAYRGRGIGRMIYAKRLEFVEASGVDVVAIEILGAGAAYSVSADARPGFSFHVRAGFAVDGYSLEDDHGPVLIRRAGRNISPSRRSRPRDGAWGGGQAGFASPPHAPAAARPCERGDFSTAGPLDPRPP